VSQRIQRDGKASSEYFNWHSPTNSFFYKSKFSNRPLSFRFHSWHARTVIGKHYSFVKLNQLVTTNDIEKEPFLLTILLNLARVWNQWRNEGPKMLAGLPLRLGNPCQQPTSSWTEPNHHHLLTTGCLLIFDSEIPWLFQ